MSLAPAAFNPSPYTATAPTAAPAAPPQPAPVSAAPSAPGFTYEASGPRIGTGALPPGIRFGGDDDVRSQILEGLDFGEQIGFLTGGSGSLKTLLGKGIEKLGEEAAEPVKLSNSTNTAATLQLDLSDEDKRRLSLKARQLAAVAETAVRLDQPKLAKYIKKGLAQFEQDPRVQAWIVPLPNLNLDLDAMVHDLETGGSKGTLGENTQLAEVIANLTRTLDALEQLTPPETGGQLDTSA